MRYTGRPSLKWLFEQDEKPEASGGEAGAAPDPELANQIAELWKLPYAAFVEKLKTVAKDPKLRAFLAAGRKDGEPGDEGVTVASKTIAGSALSPTQSEIDLGGSVAYTFKNPDAIANFYAGEVQLGEPIITAGGKWVIDGHHRWSSAMVFNPGVQLKCVDIDISDPEMALKMTQAAIATTKGNLPSQAVKAGMNIYGMGVNDIIQKFTTGDTFLGSEIVDDLKGKLEVSAQPQEIEFAKQVASKQSWAKNPVNAGGAGMNQRLARDARMQTGFATSNAPELPNFGGMGASQDSEGAIGGGFLKEAKLGDSGGDYVTQWSEAAATLAHNCKTLPAAGQFPRTIMPQTGTGDGGPGYVELGKELQSGDINSKPGFDVVKEGVQFEVDRWQVLAGIKRKG